MIRIFIQGVGVAMLAVAIGLFKTRNYKREFTLFGLAGVTLVLAGSLVPS